MIENKKIQDLLLDITPEFNSFGGGFYPLPNSVTIYNETEDGILIDLYLVDDVLTAQIWLNEDDEYILKDIEVTYIYVYLNSLLDYEIQLCKNAFEIEKERKEEQLTYYIK